MIQRFRCRAGIRQRMRFDLNPAIPGTWRLPPYSSTRAASHSRPNPASIPTGWSRITAQTLSVSSWGNLFSASQTRQDRRRIDEIPVILETP